jgi:O-antigen ligase
VNARATARKATLVDVDTASPPVVAVAWTATIAWVLLAPVAVREGDLTSLVAQAAVVALPLAAVAVARSRLRVVLPAALGLYAAALTLATILAGGGLVGGGQADRVALFTGNPNVLGAALVTAVVAWMAVMPGRRWLVLSWPVVALAVLHTGSRTSGAALLVAAVAWAVASSWRRRRRTVLAVAAGIVAIVAAGVIWQRGIVEMTPNLLAAPNDLLDPAWEKGLAAFVRIGPERVPGPFPDTLGQHLVGAAADSRRIVHQSLGRSESGAPYVASIYLRADEPQRVVLGTNMSSVTCDVGVEWRRCVTPVGYGDDVSSRQLVLAAARRGGSIDVEVFGAQYERGVAATAFRDERPSWLPQTMVNRFDLRRLSLMPVNRVVPWRAGLDIAREHVWVGVGRAAAPRLFAERTSGSGMAPVTYAHHLVIQVLAVYGIAGVAAATILCLGLASAVARGAWPNLLPLVVAIVLLNTWDVTVFEPTGLAPALLAWAWWVRSVRGDTDVATAPG